jgi:hypothetical protein
MSTEHEVQPDTATDIPGTGLTVQHSSDEEAYVHVLDDGTIRLAGGDNWHIRPTGRDETPGALVEALRAAGNS